MNSRSKIAFIAVIISLFALTCTFIEAQTDGNWTSGPCVRCETIYGLDWSPDSKFLAVAASDGLVVYDNSHDFVTWVGDQNMLLNSRIPFMRLTDQEATFHVAWNYNGTLLAAFQGSQLTPAEAHLRIWNVSKRRVQKELPTTTTYIDFDWSPVENILAYSAGDHVSFWYADQDSFVAPSELNVSDSKENPTTPPEGEDSIWRVVWSPDNRYLAVSTREDGVLIYPIQHSTDLKRLDLLVRHGETMLWSPTGDNLLIHKVEDKYLLFDINSDKVKELSLWRSISPAAWRPDGTVIAAGDALVGFGYFWNTQSWQAPEGFGSGNLTDENHISALAWSPDGKQLAFAGVEGTLYVLQFSP